MLISGIAFSLLFSAFSLSTPLNKEAIAQSSDEKAQVVGHFSGKYDAIVTDSTGQFRLSETHTFLAGDLKKVGENYYGTGPWSYSCQYVNYGVEGDPPHEVVLFQFNREGTLEPLDQQPAAAYTEPYIFGALSPYPVTGFALAGGFSFADPPDFDGEHSVGCFWNHNFSNSMYLLFTEDENGNKVSEGSIKLGEQATSEWNIVITTNRAPDANAGPDLPEGDAQVKPGDSITLNGDGHDPDDDPITFEWTQLSGSTVQLTGADSKTASFTAPDVDSETQLEFQLKVTDDKGASDKDTAIVTVSNGDFSLDCNTIPDEIGQGKSQETVCNVESIDGFSDPVTFDCDAPQRSEIELQF